MSEGGADFESDIMYISDIGSETDCYEEEEEEEEEEEDKEEEEEETEIVCRLRCTDEDVPSFLKYFAIVYLAVHVVNLFLVSTNVAKCDEF